MKFGLLNLFVAALALLILDGAAVSQQFYVRGYGLSEVVPNFIPGQEYALLNLIKQSVAPGWGSTLTLGPSESDANGYPTYAAVVTNSVSWIVQPPSQFERPGNYSLIWVGAGQLIIDPLGGAGKAGGSATTAGNCTGVDSSTGGEIICDNTGCVPVTGSISGTSLTIATNTNTGSCAFQVGQPISGAGVAVSNFGTPTIITSLNSNSGLCTSCAYTVNTSQNVSLEILYPGGRVSFSISGEDPTSPPQWYTTVAKSGTSGNQTNTARYYALLYSGSQLDGCSVNDEQTYWTGEQWGCKFKQVLAQNGFGVIRDLDFIFSTAAGPTLITTWATRKPTTYWSWRAPEMRSSLYAGTPTQTANGTAAATFTGAISGTTLTVTCPCTGTVQAAQYLDSNAGVTAATKIWYQISGTPGAAGTYHATNDSGASQTVGAEAMTAPVYSYSINVDAAPPVDKETIIVRWNNSSPAKFNTFSADNGATYWPLYDSGGQPTMGSGTGGSSIGPSTGSLSTMVFDATLGAWLQIGGPTRSEGLENGMPPEALVQLCAELGMNPWFVEPYLAADPITDYPTQLALYIKANFPTMVPEFETPNEEWNPQTANTQYGAAKTQAWAWSVPQITVRDSAWVTGWIADSFEENWVGKVGSLLGQAVGAVSSNYKVMVGADTLQAIGTPIAPGISSGANRRLLSTAYVGQNTSNIPIQVGCSGPGAVQTDCSFTQTAAYQNVGYVDVHTYWDSPEAGNNDIGTQTEVSDAYTYYTSNSSATQTGIVNNYVSQSVTNPYVKVSIGFMNAYVFAPWAAWAQNCAGGTPCTPKTLLAYEGGYGPVLLGSDLTVTVTGATNGNPCILSTDVAITGYIDDGTSGHNPGNVLTVSSNPGGFAVNQGAAVTGAGVAANTSIIGVYSGIFFLSGAAQKVGSSGSPVAMHLDINGAVQGQTIGLTSVVGGTWSASYSNLTVGAGPTGSTIPISNLDCTSLGTLTSAKLTYTGSTAYVNFLRNMTYTAPAIQAATLALYQDFVNNKGQNPSQFDISAGSLSTVVGWGVLLDDIYGYFQVATSTSSTIASSTLTLGGAITGRFLTGQTLVGKSLSGGGSALTITGCTLVGSGPCGTNVGDTLSLSGSATIGTGQNINGAVVGPTPSLTGIKQWNSGHSDLNLDPASNDNSPAFMSKAA